MSFASNAKEQLVKLKLKNDEKRPLLWGITVAIGTVIISHGRGVGVKYTTESLHVAKLITKLAQELYPLEAELTVHETNTGINAKTLVVHLFGQGVRALVHESMMMESRVPFESLTVKKQQRTYLRGVFLACGYVTDPSKSYHIELSFRTKGLMSDIIELTQDMGIALKTAKRREHFLVYAKDSEMICDFLTLIGAFDSTLELESIKIYKYTRNYANRTRNCDVANIERTTAAASAQIDAINFLLGTGAPIPERLLETAQARINHEDASLTELALMLGIGKSGVHHRIKRLMDMADELRKKGETKK